MTQKRKLHQTSAIGKWQIIFKPKPKHYDCPEEYAYIEIITGVMAVVILKTSEYTKANREDSEKYV